MPTARLTKRSGSVAILMSTYNGQRHIKEQIESILPQLQNGDILMIRDDGSTDSTTGIIESIRSPYIQLTIGENIGFSRSFLWLLYHVGTQHSAYMLADQDDVWYPNKISRAFNSVCCVEQPHLYCTRLQLVNETLQPIGLSPKFNKAPQFWNAVCENIATGCTIAINSAALNLVRRIPLAQFSTGQVKYHDWWLYLLTARFGTVEFDPQPSMLYRQHGANSIGMGAGVRRYLTIWRAVRKNSWVAILVNQLRFFCTTHTQWLTPNEIHALRELSTGTPRNITWHLITSRKLIRQSFGGSLIFRLLVLHDYIRRRIPT